MESITKIIAVLEKRVNDLQRDNDSLKQTLLHVSTTVEALGEKVSMLEKGLATKADITHVQQINKQSEIVKKINDSKSLGMDSKVWLSLDGKVTLESIVEQTTDGYKSSATNIKGVNKKEDSQNG
ncbi:hypothetical protein OCD82_00025 [Bacillus paranthracis]|uniref:hypothetical protein n=1 Tax=Bacillus paranthracis TaxID=2026186 RepID=UPI0021CF9040|nr:hypothetical protein [Bacillus paranthracis]MCU4960542.1 hypothetical protein [Bacillus paranthracis]MCU5020844.1 hypothetical protein [Bacillus paranthracis]MCU5166091.1 hypothetical protein [Bacillus paranthracis]